MTRDCGIKAVRCRVKVIFSWLIAGASGTGLIGPTGASGAKGDPGSPGKTLGTDLTCNNARFTIRTYHGLSRGGRKPGVPHGGLARQALTLWDCAP